MVKKWKLALISVFVLPFLLILPVQATNIGSNINLNLHGTDDGTLIRGITQPVSATITVPADNFSPFTATLVWALVGGSNGTNIVDSPIQTILVTSPHTTVLNQVHVTASETVSNVELRVQVNVGDFGRSASTTLRIAGAATTRGDIVLEHRVGDFMQQITTYNFGNVPAGYANIIPLTVDILNQANTATGTLNVQLVGADATSFVLAGGTGSAQSQSLIGIPAETRHGNVFTVRPIANLPARSTTYTATVVVTGSIGDRGINESFNVFFSVGATDNIAGMYTLTVIAGNGGQVSFGNRAYGTLVTGSFAPGERITLNARANSGFFFDRWSHTIGQTTLAWSESTVFTMPNNNVTVWADFTFGTVDTNPWVPAPTPNVSAVLPPVPPPEQLPPPVAGTQTPPPPPLVPLPVPTPQYEPLPIVMTPLNVFLNGSPLSFTGQQPATVQGVHMIPVGGLFTALGYTVNWDADLLQATMTRFHVTVTITEGSRNFTVNNINRNFRVPATLINGNLMVPFLEVVEAIGGRANLDANGNINIFVTR